MLEDTKSLGAAENNNMHHKRYEIPKQRGNELPLPRCDYNAKTNYHYRNTKSMYEASRFSGFSLESVVSFNSKH